MTTKIHPFHADSKTARQLWNFDCDLYRDDRSWIPPFRSGYLQHFCEDDHCYSEAHDHRIHFVAERAGQVLGHISAFVNHRLRELDQSIGTLGLFECVEDEGVASQLIAQAVDWLRNEHSIHRIWAPMNFDIWHGYRWMTRGFDLDAFVGEPRNQFYYPEYFTRFGFSVRKRWHTVESTDFHSLKDVQQNSLVRYKEILNDGYQFQRIDPHDSGHLHVLSKMIVHSYERFLGFTSPATSVVNELARAASWSMDPTLSCLVMDPAGEPCGFGIAYRDQSAAVRAMRGRLGIWAKFKFLINRARNHDRVIFYLIGISPDEFEKRHGLGRAVFYATMDGILQSPLRNLVFAIIADDSPAKSLLGRLMDSPSREYALYEMESQ